MQSVNIKVCVRLNQRIRMEISLLQFSGEEQRRPSNAYLGQILYTGHSLAKM